VQKLISLLIVDNIDEVLVTKVINFNNLYIFAKIEWPVFEHLRSIEVKLDLLL
jgi:hypothetical protein